MQLRFDSFRWPVFVAAASLFGLTACGDNDGFRSFECSTPVSSAVTNDRSALTAYTISDTEWDETAVRQVLHVFAFGGFATDAQITAWADLPPDDAIRQMLTFDPVNARLSPVPTDTPGIRPQNGSLRCLCRLFSVDSSDNPIAGGDRAGFRIDEYDAVARTWHMAMRLRGLNPFRQRIGFFETNYHLAVSSNAGLTNRQLATFYDTILNDLAADLPYERVLTNAALTAAVASQYHHDENVYVDGQFEGNEDFGREYHQLYFGILGAYDDAYTGLMADLHEKVTIPHTARALTDIRVPDDNATSDTVEFGTTQHWQGTLQILETPNDGNNARERFDALASTTIATPESLQNLPIILVHGLADDTIDPDSTDPAVMARVATVRAIWAELPTKNLLDFLRRYAISTAFHDPSRVKYWNSVERNYLVNNLLSVGNQEAYRDLYQPGQYAANEDVRVFRPSHDVFGSQTGIEAANTADVFRNAYNRSVSSYWSITRTEEGSWRKDWSHAIPRGGDGQWRVRQVAEWLWQRFVADAGQNLGPLERAHLYALLSSGRDLGFWIDDSAASTVYSYAQVNDPGTIHDTIVGAEGAMITLDSDDPEARAEANYRVSLAVNFIVATPFFMAQVGR